MGPRTTYYSLAKERLKGKHPRVYNLILIFALLSLTGSATFLISDILSFGIDYDNAGIQSSQGMSGPEKGSIFPTSWMDNKESQKAAEDGGEEKELTFSALEANSSPNEAIGDHSTSNSTGKDEMGSTKRELNSSQTNSTAGQVTGSITSASAKKAGTIASSSKSHSSSSSSSSSRSRSSSNKAEEKAAKAALPNNESTNGTAAVGTSIAQLLGSSSATISTPTDNATAKLQSNKQPAGVYRNESPQYSIDLDEGKDSDYGSEPQRSEANAAATAARMKALADEQGSEEAENEYEAGKQAKAEIPAKVKTPAEFETQNEKTPARTETAVEIETTANQETSIKTETIVKTKSPIRAEIKLKAETTAEIETEANAEKLDKAETKAKTKAPAKTETQLKTETAIKTETQEKAETMNKAEMPSEVKKPVEARMQAKAEMPAKIETSAKSQTPVEAKTPVKTETPVKAETVAETEATAMTETQVKATGEESSAESARTIEGQEIRSKQTENLAREKAERYDQVANERIESSSSNERDLAKKSESARKASQIAAERSTKLQESRSEMGDDLARERRERNDAAVNAKALAAPSSSEESKKEAVPPSMPASDSEKGEGSNAGLGPASAQYTPPAQAGKDAASLSRASALTSRNEAQRERVESKESTRSAIYAISKEVNSDRMEQSEKIAASKADRSVAAADSKATASALRSQAQSERMKAKEEARELAHPAASVRNK